MNTENSQFGALTGMAFDEAVGRLAATDPREVIAIAGETMKEDAIEQLLSAFEEAAQEDEFGEQFWLARDLQKLFGYDRWESFEAAIGRAMDATRVAGHSVDDHFMEVVRGAPKNSDGGRPSRDFELSRYACYLIAQNADPRKKPVAFAQTYFAIQTRRQELQDRSLDRGPQSEDEKRVFLRNQIKEHNRYLSSAAKNAGVITPQDFAIFHSNGYRGLYGKTVGQIKQHRGLPSGADILDRMGSTELAANFFRVTQTEEKLRKEEITGKERAFETHYAVGRQVRDAMLKISGIAPEDLPPADSIKAAEKRIASMVAPQIEAQASPIQAIEQAPPLPAPINQQPALQAVSLRHDLWKFALLVMVQRADMSISTTELVAELPKYITVPDDAASDNASRKDSKFSQIVRNLKSHKNSKTNFIFQGYAEDIKGGFRATEKGKQFVVGYFKEYNQ